MSQRWREAPPIARTLGAVTFVFSLLVYIGPIPYHAITFVPAKFVQLPPELWRLVTPIFLTDPGIGILFDIYFFYKYGAKLEVASPRFLQRAEFVTYIIFVCSTILGLNVFLGGSALAPPVALAYITSATLDSWDMPTTLIFVTIPSQYLPYAFLLFTLLGRGPEGALIHGSGIAAAHLYELLAGRYAAHGGPSSNLIPPAPEFLQKICGTRPEVVRPYGTVLNAMGPSGSATSAWGVRGWGKWGEGHRLGGDLEGAAPVEREKSNDVRILAVAVFAIIACGLTVLFMRYRDPEGWWTTLRGVLFGGDVSGTTKPNDSGLVKDPAA